MEHEPDKRPEGDGRHDHGHHEPTFDITIDNKPFTWHEPTITGDQVKHLVHAKPDYGVWLVVEGPEEDEPIGDHQHVELKKHPHARFITGPKKSTEGAPDSFLPERDRKYLADKRIAYREVVDGGQRGVIFPEYPLPAGLFDAAKADLLILIPPGYADLPPDMFYMLPWVKLSGRNALPRAADQPHVFEGRTWQRWSRHNTDWRPGVDGIWTMLKRVDCALETAAA
jgi:E2/UBC family protein E/multiubiquitin